jgi:Carboxypeptidase regulatory-like domain
MALQFKAGFIALALITVGWTSLCLGQIPQQAPLPAPGNTSRPTSESNPESPQAAPAAEPRPDQRLTGSISGTVIDQSGAFVAGAQVSLAGKDLPDKDPAKKNEKSSPPVVVSDGNGQFSFTNVAPGTFQLTITAAGFTPQISTGTLLPGEIHTIPQIVLAVAANVTDVDVTLTLAQVAQAQVKDEEKQRMLGVIPNFYATYDPHPLPITSKEKFELAWKMTVDPVTFAIVGGIAGVQQAQNTFSGYGQGAQGYAKRYGAAYANLAIGTFIGGAILPSILKQDPRYFYKGSGTKPSRILYAVANSVICKGDNGRWQPNYSNMLGNFVAGGISNLYYPAHNRGAGLTFQSGAIGIASTAAANLVEEFLMRKLPPKHEPAKP